MTPRQSTPQSKAMRVACLEGGPAAGRFTEAVGRELVVKVWVESVVVTPRGVPARLVFAMYRRAPGRQGRRSLRYVFVRQWNG